MTSEQDVNIVGAEGGSWLKQGKGQSQESILTLRMVLSSMATAVVSR